MSRKRIAAFVKELEQPHPIKTLFLANLWDCCDGKLVSPEQVFAFLDDCATLRAAKPRWGALKIVRTVCASMSAADPAVPKFLRNAKHVVTVPVTSPMSNTASYTVFLGKHVNLRARAAMPRTFSAKPPRSARGMARLKRDVAAFTAHPGWYRRDATLGRLHPYPGNCWVTTDAGWGPPDAPKIRTARTSADDTRDELGLIDVVRGHHLVTYTFKLKPGISLKDIEMARPTFADQGNRRFRAGAVCTRGKAMAADGWGSTVHLGLFATGAVPSISGRAERVTRPLEMSKLSDLQVEYLTGVTESRGNTLVDGNPAFRDTLLNKRKREDLRKKVVKYALSGTRVVS